MSLGILTLATRGDYLKAIGLSLSVRRSSPDTQIAVACSEDLFPELSEYFDILVPERKDIRGFHHKIYIDEYSPFSKTLFLDADVFVFKPISNALSSWFGVPFTACGSYTSGGTSSFGFRREQFCARIGKSHFTEVDGAGHYYFERENSKEVFKTAKSLAESYLTWATGATFADEDVFGMAMTYIGMPPMPRDGFWSRPLSARPGTLRLDVASGQCSFVRATDGIHEEPTIMHFAADEAPLLYHSQLAALIGTDYALRKAIFRQAVADLYRRHLRNPLAVFKRSALKTLDWK